MVRPDNSFVGILLISCAYLAGVSCHHTNVHGNLYLSLLCGKMLKISHLHFNISLRFRYDRGTSRIPKAARDVPKSKGNQSHKDKVLSRQIVRVGFAGPNHTPIEVTPPLFIALKAYSTWYNRPDGNRCTTPRLAWMCCGSNWMFSAGHRMHHNATLRQRDDAPFFGMGS